MTETPELTPTQMLAAIQRATGGAVTNGLAPEVTAAWAMRCPLLRQAIAEAHALHLTLVTAEAERSQLAEDALARDLQSGYVNFYQAAAINPYVALAARGPWIVTVHGAVIHDNGGYGMLGFGHAPQVVLDAMARPVVMANVMTPSFHQKWFEERMRAEIGRTRGGCPFARFLCMNSGSEAVTVALRIADANAFALTQPGARHHGKAIKLLALGHAFHGRTDRPAQASDSSLPNYRSHLASFRDRDNLVTVPPNDVEALESAFRQAEADGVFFEAMLVEPVMGEGNPGLATTRAFYDAARRLTAAQGTLLIMDSIQAGLRAHGVLSIVDYPGFADAEAPDAEAYSKALNAGQFPLSVLAVTKAAAALYPTGAYGNTMTTNPRALAVACTVLGGITGELRANIVDRGRELVERLDALRAEMPEAIVSVQGTGLLLSAELSCAYRVIGPGSVEEACRRSGLGVIHGGRNAIRLTPHFAVTPEEVELIVSVIRGALLACAPQPAAAIG